MKDSDLIWEAYITEQDALPPPPPAHVAKAEAKWFDEKNPFHHFLQDHGIHDPGLQQKIKPVDYLVLQAKYEKDIADRDKDGNVTFGYMIPKDFYFRRGKISQWGKRIIDMGGRLPGTGPV